MYFNPRARVGRDPVRIQFLLRMEISIHAPAWGATPPQDKPEDVQAFQSTRPRGARRNCERYFCKTFDFNPRARVGRDDERQCKLLLGVISIHAPAWGATSSPCRRGQGEGISIHAPAWGATVSLVLEACCFVISIHAPAWGATKAASRLMYCT